jgi:hypothetical protein
MGRNRIGRYGKTVRFVLIFIAFMLPMACGPTDSEVENVVAATLTAEKERANAVDTSVAATFAAAPSPSPVPAEATQPPAPEDTVAPPPESTESEEIGACSESMDGLSLLGTAFLDGGRLLATLEKPGRFETEVQDHAYTLMVNGHPFECDILADNPNRIYCSGRPIPPSGQIPIQLLSADSSCEYSIPLDTIPVPRAPTPEPTGPYD